MEIFPAIDLMDGKIVRLTKGNPDNVKVYDRFGDPVTVAKRWEREGADVIHIVDLDAALSRGSNIHVIKSIIDSIEARTQVGGGIRTSEIAQKLLKSGVYRVILGVLAVNDPMSVCRLVEEFGSDRVIVALDYQNGIVVAQGWKTATGLRVEESLAKFLDLGVKLFLITSVAKDGTLTGPDCETLAKACSYSQADIIAAGGISSLKDILGLKRIGVRGVVIGKALYEGLVELREAVKIAKEI